MALALALGRRGQGRVWPNPAVGCVIVKNDVIEALEEVTNVAPLSTVEEPAIPRGVGEVTVIDRHWDDDVTTAYNVLRNTAGLTFDYLLNDIDRSDLFGLESELDDVSTGEFFSGIANHENMPLAPMQRAMWSDVDIEPDHVFSQADVVLAKDPETGDYELGHSAFVIENIS